MSRRKKLNSRRRVAASCLSVLLSCWLISKPLMAQQDDEPPVTIPPTVVETPEPAFEPGIGSGSFFGGPESMFGVPGSGTSLGPADIRYQAYDNIERVLRKAPGVYLRSEDGYGNFPNISLRGVDTTRSAKLTIMEDGVLTAPAPYAAPSAYYFPTVGRMHAIEVFKGHSQIRYGPHTTGGAMNFRSTPIPAEEAIYLKVLFGSQNEFRTHTWVGDTYDTENGRWGYLFEGYLREADGFKRIDETPDFRNPDARDTGFSTREPMFKVFWEPCGNVYQRWEAKVGYTDFDANETYLGLAEADFLADPFRRYAATRFDNIASEHMRSFLRHTLGDLETDYLSLTSTLYYNTFHRNWQKLNDVRDVDSDGDGTPDPGNNSSLSRALAGNLGGTALDVLQGNRAGVLRVRNNNRSYGLWGYDLVASALFSGVAADHTVSVGLRYHEDYIRRFQRDERFTQASNGTIVAHDPGTPGDAGNRRQQVNALAFYAEDEIQFDRLTVTPGIRFEHLKMSFENFANPSQDGQDDLDVTGGGVGLTYELTDQLMALAGFHRGFSPPDPNARVRKGLEEEESLASEVGLRYLNHENYIGWQLIGFYSHFNDLIVIDNVGGAGTGNTEQVGEVFAGGCELSLSYDLGQDYQRGYSNPWFLALTYTKARQLTDSNSADEESLFAGGFAGAKVPYIPDWTISFGTGLHYDLMGVNLTGVYVDETFTSASNTLAQVNPVTGNPDARFGTTEDYFIWDLSGYLVLTDNWRVQGGVQNMFNRRYIVSRHPHGPRPGAPLFGYLAVEATY